MLEAALMGEISGERSDAFEQVVRRREALVLRTAHRALGNWADAEDVAQEVFIRLHRHGLDFPSEAAFGGWLYRVTVNLCLDRARTSRRVEELPDFGEPRGFSGSIGDRGGAEAEPCGGLRTSLH